MLFSDIRDRKVRFSDERLHHIQNDHPEMADQIERVGETLQNPDTIVRSKTDNDVELFYKLYPSTPVSSKYMCVVLKTKNNKILIITAYFTDTVKKGEVLWPSR